MKGALVGAALLGALALPASAEESEALGRKIFTEVAQPPCALCHTLKAAGAQGAIGPSLDELKPDKARAVEAIRKGLGAMPPFADKLTSQQIDAVASYVAKVAGRE